MGRRKATEKAALLQRRLEALELRKRGLSYRAIGERLGVDHKVIYNEVMAELKRLADESQDKAAEIRALELERLDALIKGLEPMAMVGNPGAVNSYIKCMERRAKYLGLDEPTKFEHDWRKEAQAAGVDDARLFEELVNAAAKSIAGSTGTVDGGRLEGSSEESD